MLTKHSNPKYTSLLVKNYFQKTEVNIIDWPPQSLILNPTEILWGELKTELPARRLTNLEERERFAKEEWTAIAQETRVRLVENYNK